MSNPKNTIRQNTPVKDQRTATEYRLSISSTPGSRRTSLGTANTAEGSETDNAVITYFLPQFRELTDAVITLDSNFTQMNFIHESLVDLNESVSALLYGLMCNSWCVDFPNMPHDTQAEIKFKQALHSLEKEKQHLSAQIALQEDQDQVSQATTTTTNNKRGAARQRSELVRLAPRTLSPPRNSESYGHAATPIPESDYVNDEDNTDASFISNPAVTNPAAYLAAEKSRRMRRKSILHVMRSSVSGARDELSDREKRRSLAVSASRLVDPPRRAASRSGTGPTNHVSAIGNSTRTRSSKDSSKTTKRPPFR
ncbi:LAFA_0D07558g1_1 [Lachancea sp. 'fantastica']|nr:LAFA_0D07558g1_1 [Lachancea sp. 'fantastica']